MYCDINELLGKTLRSITPAKKGDDEIVFECEDGSRYKMYHGQDCCETVAVEEVVGDLADLMGSPIVEAEAVESVDGEPKPKYPDSWTWTFYKLGTAKGFVTIRWLGESNGYYSESVDFAKLDPVDSK